MLNQVEYKSPKIDSSVIEFEQMMFYSNGKSETGRIFVLRYMKQIRSYQILEETYVDTSLLTLISCR